MLQAILGLDAERIASAFLVSPATMSQRLVRAKNKIRHAGIPLEIPERSELSMRLDTVLDAIYTERTEGWIDAAGTDVARRDLAEEADSRPRHRRIAAGRSGGTWPSGAHAACRSATWSATKSRRRLRPPRAAGHGTLVVEPNGPPSGKNVISFSLWGKAPFYAYGAMINLLASRKELTLRHVGGIGRFLLPLDLLIGTAQ